MSGSRIPSIAIALLFFVGLAAVGYFMFGRRAAEKEVDASNEIDPMLADAERYLSQRRYQATVEVAEEILALEPDNLRALLFAGRAAAMLKDYPGSIGYYARVPRDDSRDSIEASFEKARIEFAYRTYSRVEKELRSVLERDPEHCEANRLLAEVMDMCGRRWEAIPFAMEVVRQRNADFDTLLRLADQEQMHGRLAPILATNARDKSDPGPRLGLSRTALWEGQPEASRMLTEGVLEQRPDLIEAHVRLGGLLLDAGDKEFRKWHRSLPEAAEVHPDLWVFRGRWARQHNQPKAAARCFWEALSRNPNEGPGAKALGQLLLKMDRKDDAEPFLDRAAKLAELRKLIAMASEARINTPLPTMRAIPAQLTKLGRTREAAAWTALMDGVRAKSDGAARAEKPEDVLKLWVDPEHRLASKIDLSDWPLPTIEESEESGSPGTDSENEFAAKFEDLAQSTGLDFTYVAAPDETTPGKRIIELTGGGLGAIDFDMDSWPDVFFTQGGMYPARPADDYSDRLFRNVADGFADVTVLAGIDGKELGQGVSAADFNSDGFPDLYVGNNGRNRLYVNNGDGTFTDVSVSLGDDRTDWTTSVVMVDANGDTLPDIYVVNYVKGKVFDLICETEGVPTICGPDTFDGEQDRFYLNKGDGTFEDQTEDCGIVKPQGKGLGILVADFEETGSLQFFIANDGVPNFFFSKPQSDAKFEDQSVAAGVATSGDGVSQGCMGIAAADANGDDLLDFFVTNFDGEFNTLYMNLAGLFDDGTRQAKLHDPSYRFVGFGTQFVDGDLDGDPDLLVTNGHVADYVGIAGNTPVESTGDKRRSAVVTYRMPGQYFRNDGTGTFEELFSEDVGDFFDKEYLGRGMARFDWNKDGREDVGISYLDTPVSLLTNTSPQTGNYLAVRLVGTSTNRDAVGTAVRIANGGWKKMQQLTAGDGYQSSNERRLVFGLGSRTRIQNLEVRWLDGSRQTFTDLPAKEEITIIQGEPAVLTTPK